MPPRRAASARAAQNFRRDQDDYLSESPAESPSDSPQPVSIMTMTEFCMYIEVCSCIISSIVLMHRSAVLCSLLGQANYTCVRLLIMYGPCELCATFE